MKFFKHLGTIIYHKHIVFKCCARLGIFWQGVFHDMSKFSPTEFFEGVKYYQGFRSPTELARKENGYSRAWLHHKGRNKHHFEYWSDFNDNTHKYEPVKMPIKYLKEMLADRIAASKTYLKKNYTDASPYEYFSTHNPRDKMHVETCNLLEEWLIMLRDKGQKETLKYIKNHYKNNYKY